MKRYRIYQVDRSHVDVQREIERMHTACFPELAPMTAALGDWWFAYEAGAVAPVAFACLWPSHRVEGAGYLARAGVMPEARGAGLQRRLIKARIDQARRKGWTVVFSDVDPNNAHSLNNMVACGFRAFAPTDPWSGSPWIYLKKIIDTGVA